jgi:hypothetical protein
LNSGSESQMLAYLWRVSREVVSSELVSGDMRIQCFKPTIVDREDGELPALGIVDVKIDLAVLAMVGWHGTRTNLCDVVIIDQGEDILCSICCIGYGTGWAARTSICEGLDKDIIRAGSGHPLHCRCSQGESGSSKNEESAEIHFDLSTEV